MPNPRFRFFFVLETAAANTSRHKNNAGNPKIAE